MQEGNTQEIDETPSPGLLAVTPDEERVEMEGEMRTLIHQQESPDKKRIIECDTLNRTQTHKPFSETLQ